MDTILLRGASFLRSVTISALQVLKLSAVLKTTAQVLSQISSFQRFHLPRTYLAWSQHACCRRFNLVLCGLFLVSHSLATAFLMTVPQNDELLYEQSKSYSIMQEHYTLELL